MNNLAQPETLPQRTASRTAAELLADHNRNAEIVQSLEARPSVSGSNRSRLLPGAGGSSCLSGLETSGSRWRPACRDVADIGSNTDEFWFWFKDSPEKAVYYATTTSRREPPRGRPSARLDHRGDVPAGDSRRRSSRMKVAPGVDGTLVISLRDKTPRGVEFYKEIILSESTHRIREQNIYAADRKTLLARAVVTGYEKKTIDPGAGGPTEEVFYPKNLTLELKQDKLSLKVSMSEVKINKLEPSRLRSALRGAEPGRIRPPQHRRGSWDGLDHRTGAVAARHGDPEPADLNPRDDARPPTPGRAQRPHPARDRRRDEDFR